MEYLIFSRGRKEKAMTKPPLFTNNFVPLWNWQGNSDLFCFWKNLLGLYWTLALSAAAVRAQPQWNLQQNGGDRDFDC